MSDVERVKQALSITEVVGSYVELKNAGSNFRGLCPFHNEKTPSFMVNPTLQIYKCFGCGKGGDAISFIQEIERLSFPEALKKGAEMAGITLENDFQKDPKKEEEKARAYKAHELAAKYYHHILTTHKMGEPGRKYAQSRGLSAVEITKFQFGFAPKNYTNLKNFLNKKTFTDEELIKFGLLAEQKGKIIDKFRNRLLQPIFSETGEVIGFSGRYIEKSEYAPKYLNSPETIIFSKNENLYSLFHAKESIRKNKFVILVEGNLDVVSSHRVGIENIVAPLGTAFTREQAKKMKRYTDKVYFCFDSDNAGTSALVRSIPYLEDLEISHKVINLGDFQDSDEVINKDPKKWNELIENAEDTVSYLNQKFSEGLDLGTAEGKKSFQQKIIPVLKSIKNKTAQEHYIKDVSLILETNQENLTDVVNNTKVLLQPAIDENIQDKGKKEPIISSEYYLLALILQNEFIEILGTFPENMIESETLNKICIKLSHIHPSELENELKKLNKEEDISRALELILTYDTSSIGHPEEEIDRLFTRIYKKYLQTEIMHLRKEIAIKDNAEELLLQLKDYTEELKSL
ncbi:DNA primase [Candidatus Dojkabacteria bacterium]|uniref:DNA primase n=1 Tax=Candidatus Dojkabacteria bacterium TaxID=2099670 RepID=A0A955I7Z2_9BACT|nr:DNA primase [Candidatus Dojkabacteria bacterium]